MTLPPGVTLQCPEASAFVDSFGARFGPGAYPSHTAACDDPVLVSSFAFQCNPCGPGLYSLDSGARDGPRVSNVTCLPCPSGGSCTDGTVTATPGYWGTAEHAGGSDSPGAPRRVVLIQCPPGYCCSGTPAAPCSSVDSCAPTRTGTLCSDCVQGHVEGLGSATCTPLSSCRLDQALVWPLVVGFLFVSALVQLTVVSGVWLVQGRATGKMKSVIFFAQVRPPACRPQVATATHCAYPAPTVLLMHSGGRGLTHHMCLLWLRWVEGVFCACFSYCPSVRVSDDTHVSRLASECAVTHARRWRHLPSWPGYSPAGPCPLCCHCSTGAALVVAAAPA